MLCIKASEVVAVAFTNNKSNKPHHTSWKTERSMHDVHGFTLLLGLFQGVTVVVLSLSPPSGRRRLQPNDHITVVADGASNFIILTTLGAQALTISKSSLATHHLVSRIMSALQCQHFEQSWRADLMLMLTHDFTPPINPKE